MTDPVLEYHQSPKWLELQMHVFNLRYYLESRK